MVQINFARKEINCKIVYYGPGLSGKTTSLEVVHQRTPQGHKGELTSISTDGDRTLFFDFMPLDLGTIAGMKVKFHLYTVPGQVYYNSTRKLVLLGADGIIFVADSTPGRMDDNAQSMENLRENLVEMGRDLNKLPLVIQYNKRDLPSPISLAELETKLNPNKIPTFETSAKTGEGIFQALKAISALVLEDINSSDRKLASGVANAGRRATAPTAPAPAAKPAPALVATAAESGAGMQPSRDAAKVLRPAGVRSPSAPHVPAARPAAAARAPAPVEAIEPPAPVAPLRPTVKSKPADLRPGVGREARPAPPRARSEAPPAARTAPKAETASRAATNHGGTKKMFVFMALGVLAGAAAAVFAAKFLLHV